MKKIFGIISVVLLLCSCARDLGEEVGLNREDVILKAVLSDESETKTYLNQQLQNRWTADDRISAFVGNTYNQQYVFKGSTGDNAGDFTKVQSGDLSTGEDLDAIYAVYPYTASNSISEEGSLSVSLPQEQIYVADSFGPGANTMVAVTDGVDDTFLKFKNVCGYLVVKLYGDAKITSIILSGNNGERISGKTVVSASNTAAPSVAMCSDAGMAITLDCGEGVELGRDEAESTSFWFVVPPTEFSKGLSITVHSADGKTMTKATDNSLKIERNIYYSLSPVEYVGEGEDYSKMPFTVTSIGNTTVSIQRKGSPANITLEYRKGTSDWTTYTIGTEIELSDDESLQFRAGEGNNSSLAKDGNNYHYVMVHGTGAIATAGNIMSLLDKSMLQSYLPEYAFTGLYDGNSHLTDASQLILPATTLADYCYDDMFCGCTGLVNAPELPATSLADYCYQYMFRGCTGLVNAPELPATTLAEACYYDMFCDCTGLVNAPDLPATTLAVACYRDMFCGCTGLVNAPELPATTLAEACYYGMFFGCTSLSYVKCLAIGVSDETRDWLVGVSSTGTFVRAQGVIWSRGVSGIPSGWTVMANGESGGPEAVDLGLSVKWAFCNLGAVNPEDYGGYYQWAGMEDVTSMSIYLDWANCPYHTGSSSYHGWTKYVPSNQSSYWSGSGEPDNKFTLDPEDDVAHVKLGGKWRMPTFEEWWELEDYCTWTWTTVNGVNGYKVTSEKSGYTDKCIFLPAAGFRRDANLHYVGSDGRYWSSSLAGGSGSDACGFYYSESGSVGTAGQPRCYGLSVRPVSE